MRKRAFKASIKYLARTQGKDGGFASATAPKEGVPFASPKTHTVFAPSLIASCLATYAKTVPTKELGRIIRKIGRFIEKERGPQGTWGYFCGTSKVARDPYPHDLDDTSIALIALHGIDERSVGGEALARFVDTLATCEDRVGGPYHTWIFDDVASSRWRGIDIAVNANVGSFLALHDVHIPNVADLIDRAIASRSIETSYYDALPSAYFLARYCALRRDKASDAALRAIESLKRLVLSLRREDGTWGDSLSDSLAVSTLARLSADASEMRRAAAAIEKSMREDGSWPAAALYREERVGGSVGYAGSCALSTAFALEAVALFKASVERGAEEEKSAAREAITALSMGVVEAHIRAMPRKLKSQATRILRSMQEKGLDKLILPLPSMFRDATKARLGSEAESTYATLGAANMLGWMGYTAQDDILDEDADPSLLPVSNALLRRSIDLLLGEAPHERGKAFIRRAFDIMDDANAREISDTDACPDAQAAGEKSFGHALGPLILAMRAGIAPGSGRFDALRRFFMQYLVARQMNDDAHDWEKDLKKGRQNQVCAKLMKAYARKMGTKGKSRNPTKSALKRFFWEHYIGRISADISIHAGKARESWKKARLGESSFAEALLAPIENAAKKAVCERDRVTEFLAARSRITGTVVPSEGIEPTSYP